MGNGLKGRFTFAIPHVQPPRAERTAEGTATIGLELMRQVRGLDAVVVPVGGGGLCSSLVGHLFACLRDC